MNREVSIEPRVGLKFGDWLTGYTELLINQSIGAQKLSEIWFADTVPRAGVAPSWAKKVISTYIFIFIEIYILHV